MCMCVGTLAGTSCLGNRLAQHMPRTGGGPWATHATHVTDTGLGKLTWLVLGGDPAARSHRVEQFTAL